MPIQAVEKLPQNNLQCEGTGKFNLPTVPKYLRTDTLVRGGSIQVLSIQIECHAE